MKRYKNCPICKTERPLNMFEHAYQTPDRLHPYCSVCRIEHPTIDFGTCCDCGAERSILSFPNFDRGRPCNYCSANFQSSVEGLLQSTTLHPGGAFRPVGEILQQIGMDPTQITKSDLNAAARWFRHNGFPRGRYRGAVGYAVSVGAQDPLKSAFINFEKRYPEGAKALGLPEPMLNAYRSGFGAPPYVRYAIAAYMAGLPPVEE